MNATHACVKSNTYTSLKTHSRKDGNSSSCSFTFRCVPYNFIHLLIVLFVLVSFKVSVLTAQCPASDCHPRATGLVTQNILAGTLGQYRSLVVSSTCGPTTSYRKSSLTFDDTLYYCWANNNTHPAINMLDRSTQAFENFQLVNPQLQSYWMSDTTIVLAGSPPQQQIVLFNLTDSFLIRYIRVIFISPHIVNDNDNSDMRPRAMVFEKYNSVGNKWDPLRYYAINCTTNFPGVFIQSVDGTGPSYEANIAVCMEKYYGGDTRTYTGWGYGRQEVNPLHFFVHVYYLMLAKLIS